VVALLVQYAVPTTTNTAAVLWVWPIGAGTIVYQVRMARVVHRQLQWGKVRVDEGTNFWSTTSKEVKPDDQTVQGFLTLKEKPFKLKFALQVYPENPRTSLLRPSKLAIPDPCHCV